MKKKIIVLFLLICCVATWQPLGEDYEMKYRQFGAVTGTNDDLEDLIRMRNLAYADSLLWYGKISAGFQEVEIYSTPSITGSSTLKHTTSTAAIAGGSSFDTRAVTRSLGVKMAYGQCISNTDGADADWSCYFVGAYSTDSGANWTDRRIRSTTIPDTVAQGNDMARIVDMIFFSDGDIYCLVSWHFQDNGAYQGLLVVFDLVNNAEISSTAINANFRADYAYGGVLQSDDTYEMMYYDGTNIVKRIFDHATDTWGSASNTGLTAPAGFDVNNQQYWRQDLIEFVMDQDHFYVRRNSGDWASYADTGSTTNAIVWAFDATPALKIAYIVWKDSIYWINQQGLPLRIQEFTDDAYVGWADWFSNGDDTIYQLDFVNYTVSVAEFTSQLLTPYRARLETPTEPDTNQWLILYEDDETTIIGIYKINSYTEADGLFRLNSSGGDEIDLQAEDDVTHTAIDAPAILTVEVDTYCSFFYQDGNIDDTPATAYTIAFKNKNMGYKFKWVMAQEGYIVSWTPDYNIYYDQYSASGKTITDNNTAGSPALKTESLKWSRVVLYGGFLNGTRLTSEGFGEPGFGTYYDWYPEITTQAGLDDLVSQLLTNKNLVLRKIDLTVIGLGFIRQGQSVTLTNSESGITAETWYCIYSKYNYLEQETQVVLTDAIYIPSVNVNTEQDTRIQANQQNIATAHTDLNAFNMIGAANAAWTPLSFANDNQSTKSRNFYSAITNLDGTDVALLWELNEPTNLGSKKLYLDTLKVTVQQADANNKIDLVWVVGRYADGTEKTDVFQDFTDRTAAGAYDYDLSDIDCSAYIAISVWIGTVVDTALNLRLGGVYLKCYYD